MGLFTQPEEEEKKKLKLIPRLILHGGNGADLITTLDVLNSGQGKEANPIFGSDPNKGLLIGSKVASSLMTDYFLSKLAKKHPKLANGIAIGAGAGLSAIAARNYKIGHSK